jgi:uncharacterized membrane protein YfcA
MDAPITNHQNSILLTIVATFGAIISNLTASNVASFLTIFLAILGIFSYYFSYKVKQKENINQDLERKKLLLEIKKLEIQQKNDK